MAYRWKPSKTQRKEFAQRMGSDPQYAADYHARKNAKKEKNRSGSKFDYDSAGGYYVPTQTQHDFCLRFIGELTTEQRDAFNQVAYGFNCQEKVHHDLIHIVNELMRKPTE